VIVIDPRLARGRHGGLLDPTDPEPVQQALLRDWLALHAALCLEPAAALAALERSSDPGSALAAAGILPGLTSSSVDATLAAFARLGLRALPISSPAYPDRLRPLADAAPLLWVGGDPTLLTRPGVAIVGARAATRYGLRVAHQLGFELARAGVVVVSGLARGIDAAAHRGALEAGGATVAVQACGPDRIYPPEHADLHAQVRAAGAVIGELPPGTPPLPAYFPLRNRLISGLVPVVVVVEARARSGSLITARHALDQGREVMAVPGPIGIPTSDGPNRLLRDGARPLLEPGDVLELLGGGPLPTVGACGSGPAAECLGSAADRLAELLRSGPRSRDELARCSGYSPGDLAQALLDLELAGRVDEERDGLLRLRPVDAFGRVGKG
jgi:DNA processing protein